MLDSKINEFSIIPRDVFLNHIFPYLNDQDLSNLALVNKFFRQKTRDNDFWKNKFCNHFPGRVLMMSSNNFDWYSSFVKVSKQEYQNLTKSKRRLFYLAKEGFLTGLKEYLIRSEFNHLDFIELKDNTFLTPIDWIIKKDHQHILDYIFSLALITFIKISSIDFKAQDKNLWCIAHWAVITNQDESLIREYLENCRLNNFFNMISPLHIAAEFGLDKMIRFLVDYGFRIDYTTIVRPNYKRVLSQQTPLHLAAAKGHLSVVKTLLELKANPNIAAIEHGSIRDGDTPNEGIKPLHLATKNNHIEVVKLLLETRCSPYEEDTYKNSPLIYAATRNYEDIFNIFIQQNNEFTDITSSLNRTLFYAVDKKFYNVIEPLIKKGANPHWKNPSRAYHHYQRTAVDIAIGQRSIEAIHALIGEIKDTDRLGNFQSVGYARMGFMIGLIPGMIFLGIPGLWFVIGLILKTEMSNTLITFIVAMSVLSLGTVCGGTIGWVIGRICEQQAQGRAISFIDKLVLSSDAISSTNEVDIENPISDDEFEIKISVFEIFPKPERNFTRKYFPLTFLNGTSEKKQTDSDGLKDNCSTSFSL